MNIISATNRGTKRRESDFYATPLDCIHNFLSHYKLPDGDILECTAGNGNIIKAIREYGYTNHITAVELRDEKENLINSGADEIHICNFLTWEPERKYKTIISNPPYSIAREIIEHCFKIASKDTIIIMLLRTAFLESKKRFDFWQKYPLNGLYVLSRRPSFTEDGNTDATSYSFMLWTNSDKQEIKVI